jgi:hypothetical protein
MPSSRCGRTRQCEGVPPGASYSFRGRRHAGAFAFEHENSEVSLRARCPMSGPYFPHCTSVTVGTTTIVADNDPVLL